jgi:hypothetical protein
MLNYNKKLNTTSIFSQTMTAESGISTVKETINVGLRENRLVFPQHLDGISLT